MIENARTAAIVMWLLWSALLVGHLISECVEISCSKFGYVPAPCRFWWCPQTWGLWLHSLLVRK